MTIEGTFKTTVFVKALGKMVPAASGFGDLEEDAINQAMEKFLKKFNLEDMMSIETKQLG